MSNCFNIEYQRFSAQPEAQQWKLSAKGCLLVSMVRELLNTCSDSGAQMHHAIREIKTKFEVEQPEAPHAEQSVNTTHRGTRVPFAPRSSSTQASGAHTYSIPLQPICSSMHHFSIPPHARFQVSLGVRNQVETVRLSELHVIIGPMCGIPSARSWELVAYAIHDHPAKNDI